MKKVTSRLLFFMISISILALSGCQQERMTAQTDTTIPVRVMEVKKSSIQEFVTATGTVLGRPSVRHCNLRKTRELP